MPSRDDPLRIRFGFDGVEHIQICDPVSWEVLDELNEAWIHPKEFFMVSPERFEEALENIETNWMEGLLNSRVRVKISKHIDYSRERNDLRCREVGHCTAVENYSMHFDGRDYGERP